MATIKIHLLESRATATTYNDVSIESPNNYRIIEGEKNTTQFELVYDQNVWKDYTFSVKMVNSKGYEVNPPAITNNTFILPDGMATAGYGYIGIKAEKESKVVTFMPVKVKVWDYVEAWKGNVIDRNITFQEFVELENRVEDLEQNGTGGGSVANAVTTDTAQTITGEKTFAKPIKVSDWNYYRDGHSELYPDGILTTDEEDNKTFLEYPFQDGTIATQEFVENYVAENGGGGSSADVGEIQFCCYRPREVKIFPPNNYSVGDICRIEKSSCTIGTPVVGQYILFKNGFGKITNIEGKYADFEIVKLETLNFNGSVAPLSAPFYAPQTAGVSGQILVSSGTGKPHWEDANSAGSKANILTITYENQETAEVSMLFVIIYGTYTGGYVYGMMDAYSIMHNALGEGAFIPAQGIWMNMNDGSQYSVLAVSIEDGHFIVMSSDMQQHIIDVREEDTEFPSYVASVDLMQMPMNTVFDDTNNWDNNDVGGEGEY